MARAYITITIATLLRPDYPRIGTEAAAELVRPLVPFRAIPSHRWPSRSPILNRYLKADLSCSPINGRHQRGSRRQMAACPRPARLGSCGGRRPAV